MNSTFDFRLIHPDGPISLHIQAIWSASVSLTGASMEKPLFSDGCSGVFFNLEGTVYYNGEAYTQGAFWTPVKHQAEFITLPPGSRMAGFRFHPATIPSELGPIGKVLFGEQEKTHLEKNALPLVLNALLDELKSQTDQEAQINTLAQWLLQNLDQSQTTSSTLSQAIAAIDPNSDLQNLEQLIPLSLRQIERQFKTRVGMTPKHYQRLIRVKTAIEIMRENPTISLVDLAFESGYSDQAHMTREFQKLAKMTPGQYQTKRAGG